MIQRGDTFTRLIVIEEDVEPPKDKTYVKKTGKWHKCMCNCNKHTIVVVPESSLTSGNTKSCGCLRVYKAKQQITINREQMSKNGNTTAPKTKTRIIDYNGESKSVTGWAKDIGISKQALSKRLKKLPVEKALAIKEK